MPLVSTKIQINYQKAVLSIKKQGEYVSKTKIIINIKWIFMKIANFYTGSWFWVAESEFHSFMLKEQSETAF